jgi:hypothetical protein
MIVILGLLIVIAAAGVGAAGVAANGGSAHSTGDSFVIFGQSLTGLSTGQLFLFGIVVGIVGMLGLALLFGTFNRRLASRRSRRELKGSRREGDALRVDRDRLTQELDDARRDNLQDDGSGAGKTSVAGDAGRAGGIEHERRQAAAGSDRRSSAQEPGHAQRSGKWHPFERVGR